MKFGFDVHGVLDTHHEVYSTITAALVTAGHEVHVITGAVKTPELSEQLKVAGISYTHCPISFQSLRQVDRRASGHYRQEERAS